MAFDLLPLLDFDGMITHADLFYDNMASLRENESDPLPGADMYHVLSEQLLSAGHSEPARKILERGLERAPEYMVNTASVKYLVCVWNVLKS